MLCEVGSPPFCECALHSSHQSQPLVAKKTGLALVSDLIFPLIFFPSNSLQLPSIFFPSHAALIAWRPLFFYVYFALARTSLLCIITIAVDGINILIIDTEQESFCLSRLFLLSPH